MENNYDYINNNDINKLIMIYYFKFNIIVNYVINIFVIYILIV